MPTFYPPTTGPGPFAGLCRLATVGVLALTSLGALATSAEAASRATARATAPLPIQARPSASSDVLGQLPRGVPVHLERCTRQSEWCEILLDGVPAGWVRGSYLVGSPAKVEVTPPEFELFDPLDPIPSWRRRD